MASFNKVMLMGNLTRDPQLKYLPSQTAVAEFGLACNRKFKAQDGQMREEVTFVDCSAFGRTAETINQYCQKGKAIFIEGRLKFDSWEDKNGGGKRSKLTVVIENFQFIGSRDGGAGGGGGSYGGGGAGGGGEYDEEHGGGGGAPPPRAATRPPQRPAPARPAQPAPADPPFSDEPTFKEDDIPF